MIKLYLIGGLIVAAFLGIAGFYIAAKRAGKKEERYGNMEKLLKDEQNIKKDNIKHRDIATNAKRKWLRDKFTRD